MQNSAKIAKYEEYEPDISRNVINFSLVRSYAHKIFQKNLFIIFGVILATNPEIFEKETVENQVLFCIRRILTKI